MDELIPLNSLAVFSSVCVCFQLSCIVVVELLSICYYLYMDLNYSSKATNNLCR